MYLCISFMYITHTYIHTYIHFLNLYSHYLRPQVASLYAHCFPSTRVQAHHYGAAPFNFPSLHLCREIIVTTPPCQGPKALWGSPVFWLAENRREVYREGHKYTCCIFMRRFPAEPAAKCIFGFHLTYPFLHCGLQLPVCLGGFHFLDLYLFFC